MTTYVLRNGRLVEKNLAQQLGELHYVISDEMPETRHMADNKYYTSKAKFRAATRAHGCIEVGNETATLLKPRKPAELDRRKRADDIRRSIYELRNRRT
jgi:hypothetical protein